MRSKDAMKFSPFNKNLDDSQVTIFSFVDCIQLLLVDAALMSSIYVLTHMVGWVKQKTFANKLIIFSGTVDLLYL